MESYIFEKTLLSKEDIKLYHSLSDKYNTSVITPFIAECKKLIINIINNKDAFFEVAVYFKIKKHDVNNNIKYRPLHTADLKSQICMVAMLNAIMFDDIFENGKEQRKLSSLSNLIPSNFYGNIPSVNVDNIFEPWGRKYQEYSDAVLEKYHNYTNTKQFSHEVSLDFENFFPSIDPKFIYAYIIDKLEAIYPEDNCLKAILTKLLYCKLNNIRNEKLIKEYYDDDLSADNEVYYTKGIPQGLPQGYFFGNICMIELSKIINQTFEGDALYYVDDSVIYTNNGDDFSKRINTVNDNIKNKVSDFADKSNISLPNDILKFQSNLKYSIKVHPDGKSYISELANAHWGLSQLRLIAGETYNINSAIRTSIEEGEDETTKEKLEKIIDVIDNELSRNESHKSNDNSFEAYKKLLVRYRKFCKYRLKVITNRLEEVNVSIDDFAKDYKLKEISQDNKRGFFDLYEKEIFDAELGLLIKNIPRSDYKILLKVIADFEILITDISDSISLYYGNSVKGAIEFANQYGRAEDSLTYRVTRFF